MFSFSFFGSESETQDQQQPSQVSSGSGGEDKPDPDEEPSIASQIFGFFAANTEDGTSAPTPVFERAAQSPVAKTLSEMAQTISNMADETIRTLSPAPTQTKMSYRRKTVNSTSNLVQQDARKTERGQTISDRQYSLNSEDEKKFQPIGPHYNYNKSAKQSPLLTSFSRNRGSYKKREMEVANIVSQTRAAMNNVQKQEAYTVNDYSRGSINKKLSSIDENSVAQLEDAPEQPSTVETTGPQIRYDSEYYLTKNIESNEELENNDIHTTEVTALFDSFISTDQDVTFYQEDEDDEICNLIGYNKHT